MKNLLMIFCLLLFACAHPESPTVAIRGVTVVDVRDGSLHPEYAVLVAGNRIAAVCPAHRVIAPILKRPHPVRSRGACGKPRPILAPLDRH
jgi:hypothetical protein